MSDWRLLGIENGVQTWFKHDAKTGKNIYRKIQDVEPLLDYAQKQRNSQSRGWKGDMHHVATIPLVVWAELWKKFEGNPFSEENKPRLMALLNSREWAKLRTKEGKL